MLEIERFRDKRGVMMLKAKIGSQREQGGLYHVPDASASDLQFAKCLVHGD